jgi:pimeloyl-ACP methyl ester carboxylesterase
MHPPGHMKTRLVSLAAALGFAGCAQYSSVSEKRPAYRYAPITPIGAVIVKALETPANRPEARLGCWLDAAAAAERALRADPRDAAAMRDYNFAVGRVFEVIHDAKMQPWAKPVAAVGAAGPWEFSLAADRRPDRDPAQYHILPADRYRFHGTYVAQRMVKAGIGAPLVVTTRSETDFTKLDRFAQGKHIYYGVTALLRFDGRRCVVSFADPLSTETVRFAQHSFPLAADFTAPIALALARENPKKLELARVLRPQKYAETARLARLQPYDPRKIPVLCVHGLKDSPATWAPIITTLRADPDIRARYQFWFYSYPSGYPYPHSAAIMRQQLDAVNARYPGHQKLVLIGHSMGGCISRTMITDSGMTLWNASFSKPPEQTTLSAESRQILTDALIFRRRPEVARVIFISAPHRGSTLATDWVGRLAASLVHAPTTLLQIARETRELVTLDTTALQLNRIPNSVDTLAPNNRFVKAINTVPIAAGIPYHSIIGDRGKGGNEDQTPPVSSDGVVPYWSSHLSGAQSELIVPSSHNAHQHPQAIEEVRRILKLHAH